MPQHTPGPLAAIEDDDCIRICTADDERDWIIAEMVVYATLDPDLNDAVQMANAKLYAAAPDLLNACLAMLGTWGGQDEDVIIKARDMARAAITKATEGQP